MLSFAGALAMRERGEDAGRSEHVRSTRSVMATPAFCGPPPGTSSGSPVTLMKPDMPWMMKS